MIRARHPRCMLAIACCIPTVVAMQHAMFIPPAAKTPAPRLPGGTTDNISFNLRLRLVKCYIEPILTYNCETWTFNKDTERKIEAFKM